MTRYEDQKNFIVTTDTNSNKNLSSEMFSFNSAATSVGVGSYATRSYMIPLSKITRFYQIYVNLSIDGNEYYAVPNPVRVYSGGMRSISTVISQSGSNISINLYLVNQSPSTQNFPSFTVNIYRRDFEDEV